MPGLDVAAYHHLPTGGALRVLAEWARRTSAERVTIYTPDPDVHGFAPMPARVVIEHVPAPGPYAGVAAVIGLLRAERAGRRAAQAIDAHGHDAVFVLPSRLTQSPTLLRHLTTPCVYYAPEPLRSVYEDPTLLFGGDGWKTRLTRVGGNPIEQLRKRIDRRGMQADVHVVTHSAFTRAELRRHYGIKAEVIRLGVDSEAFRPADHAPGTSPYVLSVGALYPLKGHELIIEAVGRLPAATRPPVVVVGDRGITGPALETLAARLEVTLDVRMSIPFSDVVALMQQATVVACAQVREPFGLVPLEAMACERPVVAVDEGGLRESVIDGQTGLLVPRDAAALAEALQRLLDDAGLRERLGRAGRAAVETDWRWDSYAAELDRVLARQAAGGGAPIAAADSGVTFAG